MNVAFSTGRPAHVVLPANLLRRRGVEVTVYTAAYRGRFRNLDPSIHLRWAPQSVAMLHFLTGAKLPRSYQRADTALYDYLVGLRMAPFDLFWGWASGSLSAGRAARRLGARFVLDRACPHVDVQQAVVRTESERLGLPYRPEPAWFRDRQLAEYAEADVIVVPSRYSADSFPLPLRSKVTVAPLFGRVPIAPAEEQIRPTRPFTFGTVGAGPLRKGFLYLLQAWEQLRLPNAQLLLRGDNIENLPVLREILSRLPNVKVVGYLKDMSEFYSQCDAFVFPTVDDGFGMVLLEAVACGLPAIATTHCGAAELFLAEEDILLVPPQNVEELAHAIERIYTSVELRDSLRSHARKTLEKIEGAGTYALYSQALDSILNLCKLKKS